jgi:hypothetical protein
MTTYEGRHGAEVMQWAAKDGDVALTATYLEHSEKYATILPDTEK